MHMQDAPGLCFSIKIPSNKKYFYQYRAVLIPSYLDNVRPSCLVHAAVRDKRRMFEINRSHNRHEAAFSAVTKTSDVTIIRLDWVTFYILDLIAIYVHVWINTRKKNITPRCCRLITLHLCLVFVLNNILILGIWRSAISHLPGCFCPWTFFQNIGFNMVPPDPFMLHVATQLGYSTG